MSRQILKLGKKSCQRTLYLSKLCSHLSTPLKASRCVPWTEIIANITKFVIVCNLLTGIRAYEQLGYRAFGNLGKIAAGTAITLQNIGGEETV